MRGVSKGDTRTFDFTSHRVEKFRVQSLEGVAVQGLGLKVFQLHGL